LGSLNAVPSNPIEKERRDRAKQASSVMMFIELAPISKKTPNKTIEKYKQSLAYFLIQNA